MRKFKEFKIELVNSTQEDELLTNSSAIPARCCLDLYKVESYREQARDDTAELSMLSITMVSGDRYTVNDCSYDKFKSEMLKLPDYAFS